MKKDIQLTQEGIAELRAELQRLTEVDYKEVVRKVKESKEFGDLSENAEYDAAREEQAMIASRIKELEAILERATEITSSGPHTQVEIGATVTVSVDGDTEEYFIVGTVEADPTAGKVSVESPTGKALLGKKVGDVAEVALPDGGTLTYTITALR
jgi:transcription elongation factor GreA